MIPQKGMRVQSLGALTKHEFTFPDQNKAKFAGRDDRGHLLINLYKQIQQLYIEDDVSPALSLAPSEPD